MLTVNSLVNSSYTPNFYGNPVAVHKVDMGKLSDAGKKMLNEYGYLMQVYNPKNPVHVSFIESVRTLLHDLDQEPIKEVIRKPNIFKRIFNKLFI